MGHHAVEMSKRRLSNAVPRAPCIVQRASPGLPAKIRRNRRASDPCLICQPAACPTRVFVRHTTFVCRYPQRQHVVYKRIVTRPQEGVSLATTRNASALRRLAIKYERLTSLTLRKPSAVPPSEPTPPGEHYNASQSCASVRARVCAAGVCGSSGWWFIIIQILL